VIRGIFDHSKETLVARTRHDDRGFEVITPLYTDVRNGKLQGLFVNRGRIPIEYQHLKMHLTPPNEVTEVEGILMYSEHNEKES
jgi:cytochrome oxidase assembly protein ShyY1